jgi:hypothetical protein
MTNAHTSRDAWLQAAADQLRPLFDRVGAPLPGKLRFAIAFPSTGRKSKRIGECWDSSASADGHFEIIVRSDQSDPVDVLGILIHELTHAAVGLAAGHGKAFKWIAVALGLEGKMTATVAGAKLRADLAKLADVVGPLPHGKLGFGLSDRPKKQEARMLKAECSTCGYVVRVARKWLEVGPPHCPEHGAMSCDGFEAEAEGVVIAFPIAA